MAAQSEAAQAKNCMAAKGADRNLIIILLLAGGGWLFAQFNDGKGIKMSANGLIRVASGVAVSALIIMGFHLIGD